MIVMVDNDLRDDGGLESGVEGVGVSSEVEGVGVGVAVEVEGVGGGVGVAVEPRGGGVAVEPGRVGVSVEPGGVVAEMVGICVGTIPKFLWHVLFWDCPPLNGHAAPVPIAGCTML